MVYSYFHTKAKYNQYQKEHPHLSRSTKQGDEHDHSHELCEEDEWREEGPHWPQCYVKAATEGHNAQMFNRFY